MAMEIEFTTDNNSQFAGLLEEHGLSRSLMLEVMERTTKPVDDSFEPVPFVHASAIQPKLEELAGLSIPAPNLLEPLVSLNAQYNEVLDLDKWVAYSAASLAASEIIAIAASIISGELRRIELANMCNPSTNLVLASTSSLKYSQTFQGRHSSRACRSSR